MLFIACSMDGFIAGPDGDLKFLNSVESEGEDYGYAEFNKAVDTVIMGRKTYETVLGFSIPYPHADKKSFILTSQKLQAAPGIEFYSGDVVQLIQGLRQKEGKNIYIDGGAKTIAQFLNNNLIDEMVVSIVPQLIGQGIKLFQEGIPQSSWHCIESKLFDTGLVRCHYQLKSV